MFHTSLVVIILLCNWLMLLDIGVVKGEPGWARVHLLFMLCLPKHLRSMT